MKKILTGVMILILLSAFVVPIYACFLLPKAGAVNFISVSPDLKIRQGLPWESWQNSVTATWAMTNMKPGDSVSRMVQLRNSGLIITSRLSIKFDYSGTDDMAKMLVVTKMTYNDATWPMTWTVDLLARAEDVDSDGKISLYDLKNSGFSCLRSPSQIEFTQLDMEIMFETAAGNEFQGESLLMAAVFILR